MRKRLADCETNIFSLSSERFVIDRVRYYVECQYTRTFSTALLILTECWNSSFRHIRHWFLHPDVDFYLNETPLKNLNIRFWKPFFIWTRIVFVRKRCLKGGFDQQGFALWIRTVFDDLIFIFFKVSNLNHNAQDNTKSHDDCIHI